MADTWKKLAWDDHNHDSDYADINHNHDEDYAAISHNHAATDINSGEIDGDRLPAMSTTKKGAVPATGEPAGKYLRDDGTWATPAGGEGGGIDPTVLDANTILYAVTDNTPAALAVAASRIVGRKATGDIAAMTGAEALTVIGAAASDHNHDSVYIPKGLIDAAGDLIYGSADNTPARLAKGNDGQVLKLSGGVPTWGTDDTGGGTTVAPIILQYSVSSGTDGGSISAKTWTTRPLNTEVYDPNNYASISSNRFTLSAGTYLIHAVGVHRLTGTSRIALYNYSDSSYTLYGMTVWGQATYGGAHCTLDGMFTISGTKTFELRSYTTVVRNNDGMGAPASAGVNEIYTSILLLRLS